VPRKTRFFKTQAGSNILRFSRYFLAPLMRLSLHCNSHQGFWRGYAPLENPCVAPVIHSGHNQEQKTPTMTYLTSVAERLTKVSVWYPGPQEEGHHGDHQAVGAQWRRCPAGDRVGGTGPPRYRSRRVDR